MVPILAQLFAWVLAPKPIIVMSLGMLLTCSALGVAYSSHMTRNMYRDLQSLEKDHDDLSHEYEKLLLEQSAWADYTRLDQLARDELAMSAPGGLDTVVLK